MIRKVVVVSTAGLAAALLTATPVAAGPGACSTCAAASAYCPTYHPSASHHWLAAKLAWKCKRMFTVKAPYPTCCQVRPYYPWRHLCDCLARLTCRIACKGHHHRHYAAPCQAAPHVGGGACAGYRQAGEPYSLWAYGQQWPGWAPNAVPGGFGPGPVMPIWPYSPEPAIQQVGYQRW